MKRPRTFDELEQIVLAELLSNEFAFAIADTTPAPAGLESGDFGHPFHQQVFSELRNLQQKPAAFEAHYRDASVILAVCDALATKGQWYLGNSAAGAPDHVERLTEIVRKAPRYGDEFSTAFPRHLRELRAITYQRRLRLGAA